MKTGFTLIETLVTLAVIAIISVTVMAGVRSGEKRYALEQAGQQMIADLRKAQNMALAGRGKLGGYGVNFDSSRPTAYIIFGDQNGNRIFDAGDLVVPSSGLPSKIQIKNLTPSPLNVFFEPPDPTTYINNDSSPGLMGTIILEVEGTSINKNIIIKTSGLIE